MGDVATGRPLLKRVAARERGIGGYAALVLVVLILSLLVGAAILAPPSEPGIGVALPTPPMTPAPSVAAAAPPASTARATVSPTPSPAPLPSGPPPLRVDVQVGEAAACPAGSMSSRPGLVAQRPTEYFTAVFDRSAHRIVAVVVPYETWTFDVCTNRWTQMHSEAAPADISFIAYDSDSARTVGIDVGLSFASVWTYDLAGDSWRTEGAVPDEVGRLLGLAYDPVSGLIVALARDRADERAGIETLNLWTYELETHAWRPLGSELQLPPVAEGRHCRELAYDGSVDRILLYSGGRDGVLHLFDARTGRWSVSAALGPDVDCMGYGVGDATLVFDEAVGRTILYGGGLIGAGTIASYDAAADRWTTLVPPATRETLPAGAEALARCGQRCRWGASFIYDAANRREILLGGVPSGDSGRADAVLALDAATRHWVTLLAPLPAATAAP